MQEQGKSGKKRGRGSGNREAGKGVPFYFELRERKLLKARQPLHRYTALTRRELVFD
jgi:hypothetical protein